MLHLIFDGDALGGELVRRRRWLVILRLRRAVFLAGVPSRLMITSLSRPGKGQSPVFFGLVELTCACLLSTTLSLVQYKGIHSPISSILLMLIGAFWPIELVDEGSIAHCALRPSSLAAPIHCVSKRNSAPPVLTYR